MQNDQEEINNNDYGIYLVIKLEQAWLVLFGSNSPEASVSTTQGKSIHGDPCQWVI